MCLTDVSNLVVLRRARVEWPTKKQLGHDATQRPHVDRLAERQTEDDLGRSVVAGLQGFLGVSIVCLG